MSGYCVGYFTKKRTKYHIEANRLRHVDYDSIFPRHLNIALMWFFLRSDVKLSSLRKTSINFFIEEYHPLQKEYFLTNHLKKVKIWSQN